MSFEQDPGEQANISAADLAIMVDQMKLLNAGIVNLAEVAGVVGLEVPLVSEPNPLDLLEQLKQCILLHQENRRALEADLQTYRRQVANMKLLLAEAKGQIAAGPAGATIYHKIKQYLSNGEMPDHPAAVAAALRKAADIAEMTSPESSCKRAAESIRNIPCDQSALVEVCVEVARERDKASAKGYLDASYQVSDEEIVRRVIKGEKL